MDAAAFAGDFLGDPCDVESSRIRSSRGISSPSVIFSSRSSAS